MALLPSRFEATDDAHWSFDAEPGEFDDITEDMPIYDLAKLLAGLPLEECLVIFDEPAV